jgi:hypothetical protein
MCVYIYIYTHIHILKMAHIITTKVKTRIYLLPWRYLCSRWYHHALLVGKTSWMEPYRLAQQSVHSLSACSEYRPAQWAKPISWFYSTPYSEFWDITWNTQPRFSSEYIPHLSMVHNLQTNVLTWPIRKEYAAHSSETELHTVSEDHDLNIHGRWERSTVLLFISKGNGALKAGQSFGAQYRMGQQFTVQTLLFENIPCCRTSSACTRMTKKTNAVHKMCLQACPRQTAPILVTIFVSTVHKLSVHNNTQHHYTFIKIRCRKSILSTVRVVISSFRWKYWQPVCCALVAPPCQGYTATRSVRLWNSQTVSADIPQTSLKRNRIH